MHAWSIVADRVLKVTTTGYAPALFLLEACMFAPRQSWCVTRDIGGSGPRPQVAEFKVAFADRYR